MHFALHAPQVAFCLCHYFFDVGDGFQAIHPADRFHFGAAGRIKADELATQSAVDFFVTFFIEPYGKLYDECTYTYGTNANKLKTGIKNLSLLLQNNAYINGRAMQDILYYGLFYNDNLPTVLNYKNYDGETPSGVYNLTYTFNANGQPA